MTKFGVGRGEEAEEIFFSTVLTNCGLAEEKQPREKEKFKGTGSRQQILTKQQWFYSHDCGLAESEGENSAAETNKGK